MRFTKQTIVMVVTLVLSSVTATPVEIGVKELGERGKYDPAIAFATFTDSSCSSGQVDYHQADGICNNNLPGQSMKIWWLASGCRSTSGSSPLIPWLSSCLTQ